MNDFTPEELKIAYVLINELLLESSQPPCAHELKEKIKLMIDNYCDHQLAFHIDQYGNYVECRRCNYRFQSDLYTFRDIDLKLCNPESL